jgi:hypothetical protein
MRLYTAFDGNQPMLTINAGSIAEARYVLAAILGCDDGITVRQATPAEADAWRQTASAVERQKMRRVRRTPAHRNAGAEKSTEESVAA